MEKSSILSIIFGLIPGLEAKMQSLPKWTFRLIGTTLIGLQYYLLQSNGLDLTELLSLASTTTAVLIGYNAKVKIPPVDTEPLQPVGPQAAPKEITLSGEEVAKFAPAKRVHNPRLGDFVVGNLAARNAVITMMILVFSLSSCNFSLIKAAKPSMNPISPSVNNLPLDIGTKRLVGYVELRMDTLTQQFYYSKSAIGGQQVHQVCDSLLRVIYCTSK